MFNYSFWADEAGITSVASQIVQGKLLLWTALQSSGIEYQKLYIILVAFSFKLFGMNEFAARFPSMIAFAIGIIVIFFLARKFSNFYGGILASFLYAFSHLNLAYATQAKPYTIIETILLCNLLLISKIETEKNTLKIFFYHFSIILLTLLATFIHNIGVFLWLPYFVYILANITHFKKKYSLTLIVIFIVVCFAIVPIVLSFRAASLFMPYNNSYQVIKLFFYKYSLITVISLIAFLLLYKKNIIFSIGIAVYTILLLFFVTFEKYVFNIRYVLSLFAIMFFFFGVFWAKIGEHYLPKKSWLIPLIVIITLYLTGYKIVRTPQTYYNPNIDKYGDVQIADYKDFYLQLKKVFPSYMNIFVINDTFDAENWYFGRYSNVYFMKFTVKPYIHPVTKVMVYGSLDDFKKMIADHPQGLLIMEDWQSFLPDDIKDYAKKNLKLEFRVESLKEAPNDPWPLALYSWGYN